MAERTAGKIRLSKQTWVPEGTVNIRNGRHVILQAGLKPPALPPHMKGLCSMPLRHHHCTSHVL